MDDRARGIFITLEGVDGSGKSTKARMLGTALEALGREVLLLREPGGTPISEMVRDILLDPRNTDITPEAELMLYEASRAQLVTQVIRPALERGVVVICDRFYDSTYAYQAVGRGLPEDDVRRANALGSCGLVPDRTIVFDLSPHEALDRATHEDGADRMEGAGVSFQRRVRRGYLKLAEAEPERVRVVDGTGEKEQTYERMVAQLIDILPELEGAPTPAPAHSHDPIPASMQWSPDAPANADPHEGDARG